MEWMKTCSKCGLEKPLAQFSRQRSAKDGLQARCRECWKQWYAEHRDEHIENVKRRNRNYYAENRQKVAEYLEDHPCVDCDESDPRVLHFDHIDPATKTGNISRMIAMCQWDRIRREIEKCEVRCANCHSRRTAEQFGYWSATGEELMTIAQRHDRVMARLRFIMGRDATA